jgi:hypothetical protein
VQIQVCTNHGENHFYICLYQKKTPEPVDQFQSNLIQIILAEREFQVYTNKVLGHIHLRKPSVRFSLTSISPLADFNATEMPSIGMSIEPLVVLILQRKKSFPQ